MQLTDRVNTKAKCGDYSPVEGAITLTYDSVHYMIVNYAEYRKVDQHRITNWVQDKL